MIGPEDKNNIIKGYLTKEIPLFLIFFAVPLCILFYCGFFSTEEELKNFTYSLFILYLIGEGKCEIALLFIKKCKENEVPDNSKKKLVMKVFNICAIPSLVIYIIALAFIHNFLSNKYIVVLFGYDLLLFIMVFLFCCKKILSYNSEDNSNK